MRYAFPITGESGTTYFQRCCKTAFSLQLRSDIPPVLLVLLPTHRSSLCLLRHRELRWVGRSTSNTGGALCVFYDRRTCLLLRYFPVSLSLLYSRNSGKVKAKKLFSYKSCLTNIFFFYLSFSQSYICQKVLNISYIIIEFSVKYAMINLSYDARVRGSITL